MDAVRERTLVGLFVLIAGGLLLGTIVVISGGLGVATVSHRAYFKFAAGVQAGAPVRYGGMSVGKVPRANDLLNERNRASIAGALSGIDRMVAEVRPKANDSLDNLNGMLTETRPEVAASLSYVQELTIRLGPLLDSLNTTTARANDTL